MDPIESEIINDPVIRAQYDAALALDMPLRRRPHSELARLQELEEAVQEAWDAYDQGHSAKQAIRMVGKALGWA